MLRRSDTSQAPGTLAYTDVARTPFWSMIQEFAGYQNTNVAASIKTFTVDIASPCTVTCNSHGFSDSIMIRFTTTGALPTGLTTTDYFYTYAIDANTFGVRTTYSGSRINTSGTQSGVHTVDNVDNLLNQSYYDMEECAYRLADRFSDTGTYYPVADNAYKAYATDYVNFIVPPGQVQGYRNFPMGLAERFIRRADAAAVTTLNNILANNNYCINSDTSDDLLSREGAYALETLIHAERAGISLTGAQKTWRTTLLNWQLGIINQWCVTLVADYFRPFMGALTAKALIDYYTYVSPDPRIPAALAVMGDYAWNKCYREGPITRPSDSYVLIKSMTYTDRDVGQTYPFDLEMQPDLNMLIAPMYGWLFKQTKNTKWQGYANNLYLGGLPVYSGAVYTSGSFLGARNASGVSGKQIDQQLYWGPTLFDNSPYIQLLGPIQGRGVILQICSTLDQDVWLSLDGGVTDFVRLPATKSITLQLGKCHAEYSGYVAVRPSTTVPTTGFITANVLRVN